MWDKTVQQIVREAHSEGAWDLLRRVLDHAEQEPGHECQTVEWARRLYRDPEAFSEFVHDCQRVRESR